MHRSFPVWSFVGVVAIFVAGFAAFSQAPTPQSLSSPPKPTASSPAQPIDVDTPWRQFKAASPADDQPRLPRQTRPGGPSISGGTSSAVALPSLSSDASAGEPSDSSSGRKHAKRTASSDPQTNFAFEEIMRLREGNGTLLRGTLLEKSPQASGEQGQQSAASEFERALRVAADNYRRNLNEQSVRGDLPTVNGAPSEASLPATAWDVAPESDDAAAYEAALIRAGSALDQRATRLEQQRHYTAADRLRRLARRLRRELRADDTGLPFESEK